MIDVALFLELLFFWTNFGSYFLLFHRSMNLRLSFSLLLISCAISVTSENLFRM